MFVKREADIERNRYRERIVHEKQQVDGWKRLDHVRLTTDRRTTHGGSSAIGWIDDQKAVIISMRHSRGDLKEAIE